MLRPMAWLAGERAMEAARAARVAVRVAADGDAAVALIERARATGGGRLREAAVQAVSRIVLHHPLWQGASVA